MAQLPPQKVFRKPGTHSFRVSLVWVLALYPHPLIQCPLLAYFLSSRSILRDPQSHHVSDRMAEGTGGGDLLTAGPPTM